MKKLGVKKVLALGLGAALLACSVASHAREYVQPFTPTKVVVADGFLQVVMPNSISVEGCAQSSAIVLPDNHKYFDAYLSMAMTAHVTGQKIAAGVGAPCQGNPEWPYISVMQLLK